MFIGGDLSAMQIVNGKINAWSKLSRLQNSGGFSSGDSEQTSEKIIRLRSVQDLCDGPLTTVSDSSLGHLFNLLSHSILSCKFQGANLLLSVIIQIPWKTLKIKNMESTGSSFWRKAGVHYFKATVSLLIFRWCKWSITSHTMSSI